MSNTITYTGNITRGMWVQDTNARKGVIVETHNLDLESCEIVHGVMGSGGGSVDIVWNDGGMSRQSPECFLRAAGGITIKESITLADESTIEALLAKAEQAATQAKNEEKAAAEAKNAQYQALKTNPQFSHLDQIGGCAQTKDVAKNIRKHLKKLFPTTKFSVRCHSYSCINIDWTDGVTQTQVDNVVSDFEKGHFNGMEDIYEYESTPFNSLFGSVKYIQLHRSFSDEHIQLAIDKVTKGDPLEGKLNVAEWKRGGYMCSYLERSCKQGDDVALLISHDLRARDCSQAVKEKPKALEATQTPANPNGVALSEVIESVHTKKHHDIFIVSIVERVARETYLNLKQQAKALGGYYSSYSKGGSVAGFIFKDKEQANEFIKTAHA